MNELLRLSLAKSLTNFLPVRIKKRFAKFLYNLNSTKIKGINLIVDYDLSLDLKIFINTKEFSGWNIFIDGSYEADVNNILKNYIHPDDIIVEAGAHIGTESLIIAKLIQKGKGKLFAFEPNPIVNQHLKINVALNDLENCIEIYPYALGNNQGIIDFHILAEHSNQGMSSKYQFKEANHKINIKEITLDAFIENNNIHRLDFIKMDIQGSEIDLIHGAEKVINRFKPKLLLEADITSLSNSKHTIEELWKLINKNGYIIKSVSTSEEILDCSKIKKSDNWLALPR